MLKSIFNSVYLLVFLRFLRTLYRKLVPSKEDLTLPRYLILAMFDNKAILLGYSDSYSVCQKYADESRWAITISEYTGTGYLDVAISDTVSQGARNDQNTSHLESMQENAEYLSCERDFELGVKYGFSEVKMAFLVKRFRNGHYV